MLDICSQVGVLTILYAIKIVIKCICIGVPIILIISLCLELVGVVTDAEKEFDKMLPNIAKKMIAAAIIFLVPTIVGFVLNIVGFSNDSTCLKKLDYDYIKSLRAQQEAERKRKLDELNNDINNSNISNFNSSGIDSNIASTIEECLKNYQSNLEPIRVSAIEAGASLVNKGIKYDMNKRNAVDANGFPTFMDCSSFVTYSLIHGGYTGISESAYTGTYISSNKFTRIKKSELIPGDIALQSDTTTPGGANHVVLYVGKNNAGQTVWLECNPSSGPTLTIGRDSYLTVFLRYNNY